MVYKLTRRPSQKEHLLERATALVAERGVEALTIDGLAQSAGVTKGGVQYHFRTKDTLVTELLQFLMAGFEAAVENEAGAESDGRAWLRAYVLTSLGSFGQFDRALLRLLLAMPLGDARAEPFRLMSLRFRERSERGLRDTTLAHIIRTAVDGAWLERCYGEATAADVKKLKIRLLALVEDL
jgi:AcrR family transcriptional regulator